MIKKVSSWVLGSFFRQVGRFLFFLILGGLVFLLISHNNINIKLTDLLGIYTVKASEVQQAWVTNITDTNGNWADSELLGGWYVQKYASTGVIQRGGANLSPQVSLPRHGDIYINGYLESSTALFGNQQRLNCTNVQVDTDGNYCTEWTNYEGAKVTLQIWLNSYGNQCKIEWNDSGINIGDSYAIFFNANCQTQDRTIGTFYYYYSVEAPPYATSSYSYRFGVSRSWKYEITASNAVENQAEQQEQQHNETINTITDTNTTADIQTADDFFTNTTSSSESALTDIVTSPLTLINSLVTESYNNLCFTLNEKQVCLPSGDIIWNRSSSNSLVNGVHDNEHYHHWFHGGSINAFITFFNLVVGGYILYKCLVSLFHSIHNMLDPAKSYVEVVKL